MRSLVQIVSDIEEALGRDLTVEEYDRCYIMKLCGSWGFYPLPDGVQKWEDIRSTVHSVQSQRFQEKNGEPDQVWYIAKPGIPVDWQPRPAAEAALHIGIICNPHVVNASKRIYAQFIGERRYKVYLSLPQAQDAINRTLTGESLLDAVEYVTKIPMEPLNKRLMVTIREKKYVNAKHGEGLSNDS